MHLIRVLLPDPEGPQITTTSPRPIAVVQPRSTAVEPYDFHTLSRTIIGASVIGPSSTSCSHRQPGVEQPPDRRDREAEDEIGQCDEADDRDRGKLAAIDQHGAAGELVHADHGRYRGE